MGLFKYHVLLGTVAFLAAAATVQADFVELKATVTYDTRTSCTGTSNAPVQVTAVPTPTTCTADTTCVETPSGSSLFPATVCSVTDGTGSGDFIQTTVPYLFGSSPYIVVESYAAGQSCSVAGVSGVTVYLADGQCHKTDVSASYTATRAVDGSVTVLTYGSTDCSSTPMSMLDASGAQVKGQSCAADANGVLDTKIYGTGFTTVNLKATVTFDTNSGACLTSATVPIQETLVPVSAMGCTATSVCMGAGPYTSLACTTASFYQADVAAAFGAKPYVIVEAYAAGKNCDGTKLSSITTYLADGRCHETTNEKSYVATRASDQSVTIITYTDSVLCDTTGSTLVVSADQAISNSCANDGYGIPDMKVYGSGETPLYLKSMVSYETNTGSCMLPEVPIQVSTAVATPDTCLATAACTGSAPPYLGVTCSTTSTFKSDMAVMFGSNPYVIVERYTPGKSCSSRELMSITIFLADSKCHKTGASASYKTDRNGDGSVSIQIFTDSSCNTNGATLVVTAAQAMANSCSNDGNGIIDAKVYGSGVFEQYLKSTATYDTRLGDCMGSVVPTQLFSTMVAESSCEASNSCIGTASPYNSTLCSFTSSYQNDIATLFGSSPYVTVTKYAPGRSCDVAALADIRSYVADTKCHRTGSSTSFRAIHKVDGSATIMTYANSGSCSRGLSTFAATSEQANNNSCAQDAIGLVDTKVYGRGTTPLFLTVTAIYDSKTYDCNTPAIPVQWIATTVSVDACVPSVGCRNAGASFTSTVCSNTNTYPEDVAAAFSGNQFVTVERYTTGKGCAQSALASVVSYLADQNCHSSSSTASFRATTNMDGSARVDIFVSSSSCDYERATLALTVDQVNRNVCISTGYVDIKVSAVFR